MERQCLLYAMLADPGQISRFSPGLHPAIKCRGRSALAVPRLVLRCHRSVQKGQAELESADQLAFIFLPRHDVSMTCSRPKYGAHDM